ncbi:tRNA1(Val) (adenine(37)-N6)-methyltransferase [Pseudodesulfovibrio hydrargyri]|uniref:tRNA1(Val) (Adenine(37)-N6)-methyltransferase n=1 Tax=Pseudodesulfovibrio hydrargyri TaxID=2125990 RepID=A0A1J5N902_9BACT|nr:methyltransferase [Pseudodesulfovibrio hydrargyri]OIQ49767.1 tRNA1(Val) (adenine(37)-N6)-methyltransferase [Pseudodesulfovibrio hydrargyri]
MSGVNTRAILDRRAYFPRGLVQPEGGYRFSLDSLLLASFANVTRGQTGLDLGCGCGVIGLALLLRQPGLRLTGVELNPQSVEAAKENAANLHLTDKLTIEQGDVVDWRSDGVVDFVVANPPYRKLGQGRESAEEDRRNARFEGAGTFAAFARCAAVALKTRGRFAFVHLPERLPEIMAGLADAGLASKRLRMVHGKADQEARMVLVETVQAASPGLRVEPPLILHEGTGKGTRLTGQALDFCPFLACNPKDDEEEDT